MGFFDKLKKGLNKTRQNFTEKIERLALGYARIDDEFLEELEETLLFSDVGVQTTEILMDKVRQGIKEKKISNPQDLQPFLISEITAILERGEADVDYANVSAPAVILVIGVNGVGKTTTIGKLASYYQAQNKSVLLAAADTFRAAAIDQLQIWGERTGTEVIAHAEGSDPAAVVYDALQAAKARKKDMLIIDTAGRLHNKKNLMDELNKIYRIIQREIPSAPHDTLLVLDAGTGQNAIHQTELFTQVAPITGIVLTKLDGTAKGGVIIGLKSQFNIPIKWVGVGEGERDLQPFVAKDFATALFSQADDTTADVK